ncbi:cyclin-like protein [Lipomyces oligophaga]|uniref:cyclin-like protein n=1 Tax=Lipomyces oligophaga TaxID=45792 RepID=UPI0034CEEDFA
MASTRRSTRTSASVTNDENNVGSIGTTRLTRAKAAREGKSAIAKPVSTATSVLSAKHVDASGKTTNTRKRAALGDVSNVHKDVAGNDGKDKAQHAAKLVKTSTLSKSRVLPRTATISSTEQQIVTTENSAPTNATTRRKRAPLKPLSSTSVAQRSTVRRTRTRSTQFTIQEEEDSKLPSDANKENEDPAKAQTKRLGSTDDSSFDDQEYVEAAENLPELEQTVVPGSEVATASQEVVQDWDDLDADEMDDPTMVAEYVNEIFQYMSELEVRTMPNPRYMDNQGELLWKMRDILVDWLVEVHTKFRLLPETLFLAVNIVDRFLSLRVVGLDKLQLVGITGLFIAAKYEEVFSPSIQNFIYVVDSGYTEEEMLKAETYILKILEFNLSYPNPMNFLRRNSKADNYDIQTRTVAKYLMEIGMVDHRFMKYVPSHIAATAMYLARVILERPSWDKNLVHYSGGYTEESIRPVCELMIDYLVRPVRHEAFFKKYASKRFLKASIISRQWAKKYVEEHPGEIYIGELTDEGEEE